MFRGIFTRGECVERGPASDGKQGPERTLKNRYSDHRRNIQIIADRRKDGRSLRKIYTKHKVIYPRIQRYQSGVEQKV
jgi:hypothetical protein